MTKIDAFAHIMTERYLAKYRKINPAIEERIEVMTPPVAELDIRFRLMNRYADILQVLAVANVPLETFAPQNSVDLGQTSNEELAELVIKYPDKFFGAAAAWLMNDMDAALKEAE